MNLVKIFDCTIVRKKNLKNLIQQKKIFGVAHKLYKLI